MRLRLKGRLRYMLGLGGACVALLLMAAQCEPPHDNVAATGSFTTQGVMDGLSWEYASQADHSNPAGDSVTDVPSQLTGTLTAKIPAKNKCPGITYNSTSNPPPNGSSAGITALLGPDGNNGCIDVARSSRGRSSNDPASLDFYAYAIDGVSWAGFSGGHQPMTLTQTQLQGIYLCTNNGQPAFTDWSQVGGSPGLIVRYLPQVNSGTLSFFETRILGLSSAQQGVLDDSACTNRPLRIEESHGDAVFTGFRPLAILPYSIADWNAQQNGVSTDHRGGSFLGAINGVPPTPVNLGEGCTSCFLGRRYVYNVVKQGEPEQNHALQFVGIDASNHNGYICGNNPSAKFIIAAYGFVNLPVASAGAGLPNSTCRKNPAPL